MNAAGIIGIISRKNTPRLNIALMSGVGTKMWIPENLFFGLCNNIVMAIDLA